MKKVYSLNMVKKKFHWKLCICIICHLFIGFMILGCSVNQNTCDDLVLPSSYLGRHVDKKFAPVLLSIATFKKDTSVYFTDAITGKTTYKQIFDLYGQPGVIGNYLFSDKVRQSLYGVIYKQERLIIVLTFDESGILQEKKICWENNKIPEIKIGDDQKSRCILQNEINECFKKPLVLRNPGTPYNGIKLRRK